MSQASYRSTLDGLPRQFIQSLRTLFDILDEGRTGFVYFTDIENRWREDGNDGVAGLPEGVLEALSKVTPDSGKLSFERFVAGLKIALLRNKSRSKSESANVPSNRNAPDKLSNGTIYHGQRAGTASSRDIGAQSRNVYANQGNVLGNSQRHQYANSQNLATVRPSNYEHLSKPRPSSASDIEKIERNNQKSERTLMPPPAAVPIRQDLATSWRSKSHSHIQKATQDKENSSDPGNPWQRHRTNNLQQFSSRGFGDGRASIASTSALDQLAKKPELKEAEDAVASPSGRRGSRRRDSRRHTLNNGIDFNTIKRLKQLEKEKDVLLQGLQCVDQGKEWYTKQLAVVEERIKTAGKGILPNDYSMEAHQEHMNFLAARIGELNQQIKALVESSEKGFPLHMNLALTSVQRQEPSESENVIAMLKAQNKMLTQDVARKTEKINQLEREKSTLVREVFETRSSKSPNYNDTTFL